MTAAVFDLSTNNVSKLCEEGYRFELVIPEVKKPTGIFLTVRGDKSKIVTDFARKKYNELAARDLMAKKRGRDREEMSLEDAEELIVEQAAIRIQKWENVIEDGKPVEFTEANVKRILREHAWIREAVMQESNFLGNFVKT